MKYSQDQIEKIYKLRAQGKTALEISKALKMKVFSVNYYLQKRRTIRPTDALNGTWVKTFAKTFANELARALR